MSGRETKWTPGPWSRIDTPDYAEIWPAGSDRKGSAIALVARQADADLIVVVTNLYETLSEAQELLADLARPADGASAGNAWARCVEIELKARKALEKARGPA